MCGRFVATSPASELAAYFSADVVAVHDDASAATPANYNVAPTTDISVVHEETDHRRVDRFRWGLVPSWAKDLSIGSRMINARSESVADKPAFRRSFERRRCIIPADGFYEWRPVPGQKVKQPFFISRPDGEPYAFGGLWAQWYGELGGEEVTVRSATIVTGPANEKMAELHDRMPLILPATVWAEWLDPSQCDVDSLKRLLVPAPSELITFRPVSTLVNNVRNNGPELLDAPEVAQLPLG